MTARFKSDVTESTTQSANEHPTQCVIEINGQKYIFVKMPMGAKAHVNKQ